VSSCPHAALLHLDDFADGTLREAIAHWLSNPRLLAEPVYFGSNFMDGLEEMHAGFDART